MIYHFTKVDLKFILQQNLINRINLFYICALIFADVLKLVDKPVLGTGALRREGSSPFIRTQKTRSLRDRVFYFLHPVSPHRDIQAPYFGVFYFNILIFLQELRVHIIRH